jgi:hypothetical protein
LDKETVLGNLCSYDKRNPNSEMFDEDDGPEDECYCDNCYYGRTKLAEEILRLQEIKEVKDVNKKRAKKWLWMMKWCEENLVHPGDKEYWEEANQAYKRKEQR